MQITTVANLSNPEHSHQGTVTRTPPLHWCSGSRLGWVLVGISIFAVLLASSRSSTAQSSDPTPIPTYTPTATPILTRANHAGLVVQLPNGDILRECVPLRNKGEAFYSTGEELLKDASIGATFFDEPSGRAVVCHIAGTGCAEADVCYCDGERWHNYHQDATGQWREPDWPNPNEYFTRYQVESGMVEGWVWGPEQATLSVPGVFAELCAVIPTTTPTPSDTATPTATPTLTPTLAASSTAVPTLVQTASLTNPTGGTSTSAPTSGPDRQREAPAPAEQPVEISPTPAPSPTPTPTWLPRREPTRPPTAMALPVPTSTPLPAPSPLPPTAPPPPTATLAPTAPPPPTATLAPTAPPPTEPPPTATPTATATATPDETATMAAILATELAGPPASALLQPSPAAPVALPPQPSPLVQALTTPTVGDWAESIHAVPPRNLLDRAAPIVAETASSALFVAPVSDTIPRESLSPYAGVPPLVLALICASLILGVVAALLGLLGRLLSRSHAD